MRGTAATVAVTGAAALVGFPSYARAWWETGSPLYPVAFSLGGLELFPGNPELVRLLELTGPAGAGHWPRLARSILDWRGYSFGLGPLSPLAALLGAVGFWRLARRPPGTQVAILLLACMVLAVPVLFDPALWNRIWGLVSPRYLLPSFGALVVCAALVPGRALDLAWFALIASGLVASWPKGFVTSEWGAMAPLLAGLAACAIAWTAAALSPRPRPAVRVLASAAVLGATVVVWQGLRDRHRYAFYESAALGRSFDTTPLAYARSWPVWQVLDDGRPHRLAVVAGWDGVGHNWFQYPLFGSRLQNTLLYVPPTRDRAPLHYGLVADPFGLAASSSVWIERLAAAEVDVVVLLAPTPPVEADFVRAHPDRFERLACSADGASCAYRFVRESRP
jgi:hypothetical protein